MTEPICVWSSCTNRAKLFSRESGIRICGRECLDFYARYKEEASKANFRDLWFLHISLLQQYFHEKFHYGFSEMTRKLVREVALNNAYIVDMAPVGTNKKNKLEDGLVDYLDSLIALYDSVISGEEVEKREKEWDTKMMHLLSILQLSEIPTLVEAMRHYASNLLKLMYSIVKKSPDHYCLFRVLVVSVTNLAQLIESNLARESPSPEVKTMMLRPENGRSKRTQSL